MRWQSYLVEVERPMCPFCLRDADYLFRVEGDADYPYTIHVRCFLCIDAPASARA